MRVYFNFRRAVCFTDRRAGESVGQAIARSLSSRVGVPVTLWDSDSVGTWTAKWFDEKTEAFEAERVTTP